MIQNYLDSALKKKWIHSSSNFAKAFVLFVKKVERKSSFICELSWFQWNNSKEQLLIVFIVWDAELLCSCKTLYQN